MIDRIMVIDLIGKKLNNSDYCENINCGTVTDYMCILLENGFTKEEIELASVKPDKSKEPYIKIHLDRQLSGTIIHEMSGCCGYHPNIFVIDEEKVA